MTGFFDKLKGSKTKKHEKKGSGSESEQTFSIQPHPATTNDPADLQGQEGGGLQCARDPAFALHQSTPGPVIPEGLDKIPVEDKEELKARAAELNK